MVPLEPRRRALRRRSLGARSYAPRASRGVLPKGGDSSEPPDEVVPKWDHSSDFPRSRRPVARARRLSLRDSSARRAFPTGQRRFARTMDATQTMSETARSSFLGDTMPHILAVRAFPPRRASLPAPTAHFWHSRAGDWDALAITSDSAHLPRTFPTHPYPPPVPTTSRPARRPRATPMAPRRASNPRSASRPSAPPPPPRSESAFPFRPPRRARRSDDRFDSRPGTPGTPVTPVTRAPISPSSPRRRISTTPSPSTALALHPDVSLALFSSGIASPRCIAPASACRTRASPTTSSPTSSSALVPSRASPWATSSPRTPRRT